MNRQNKFVTRWATWVIMPDGYAYTSGIIWDSKDACDSFFGEMMKDPCWNGYKFIHVPISILIPDEVANKVDKEEDND